MNCFRHLLHPKPALWARNPSTFRDAGMSQLTLPNATLTVTETSLSFFISIPLTHAAFSSVINGVRYEFIVRLGSLGPGLTPIRSIFSKRCRLLLGN